MPKKSATGGPKDSLKKDQTPVPGRGRPPIVESKKLTKKFIASFSNSDFSELKQYELEENVTDHSQAARNLVKLGLKLRALLHSGKIKPADLLE